MNALPPPPRGAAVGPPGRRGGGGPGAGTTPIVLRSPHRVAAFERIFTRFFRRHMRALRLARRGPPHFSAEAPVVVFINHPSWWDGVAIMLLARRLRPDRPVFIPMEAAALARYPFMRRLGVFGVEAGSPRGAAAFLRTAAAVLAQPRHMLWMNAPGRFCDARERPVPIVPGLTRLPEFAPEASFVPLALEYPFWTERKPEMLAAFGPPIPGAELAALGREARATRLAAALEAVMDGLAEDAIARDPARFETLIQGREGMGGIYQLWSRLRAALRGTRYDPRHDPGAPPTPP